MRPWRWRFFWLFLLPTFRLALPLSVLGSRRHAAALPLLLLLLLLLLLWRGRLTRSALHSFSLAPCFTCSTATWRGRDRLTESRRRTSATLITFTCARRRRRAESLTLRSLIASLWRNLPLSTLPGTWLLA
jgi:hypothetical protein